IVTTAFFGDDAGLVADGLLLKMIEGFTDGRVHVACLGKADQRADSRVDGDLGLVTTFFDCENYFGVEFIAQNLAEFSETGFDFLTVSGSYFVLPASVFHIHASSLVGAAVLVTQKAESLTSAQGRD